MLAHPLFSLKGFFVTLKLNGYDERKASDSLRAGDTVSAAALWLW